MQLKHLLTRTVNWKVFFLVAFITSLSFVGVMAYETYTPTVSSDKDDYSPGQTAIITGYGWTQDQYVDIHLEETPTYHVEHEHDYHGVKVNTDGSWKIEYKIEDRHLGVKFDVKVIGKQTGKIATTTFTDAGIGSVTVVEGSTLCTGNSISIRFEKVSAQNNGVTGQFAAGATFIAELTDGSGTTVIREIGRITDNDGGNGPLIITGNVPTVSAGAEYKVRVRSINPITNNALSGNLSILQAPTTANAGADQLNVSGTSTTLAANAPTVGTGTWSVVSGTGGSFGSAATSTSTNRAATFNGTAGSTYVIRWTITNGACTSTDDVTISFSSIIATTTTAGNATAVYSNTSVSLGATVSPAAATGSVEFVVNGVSVGTSPVTNGAASFTYNLNGVNAGDYTVRANFTGTGVYTSSSSSPSANGTLKINPAAATITVAGLAKTYNGSAQGATVTTSPAGLAVNLTYEGVATVPTAAGTYAVVAALNNSNYTAANGTGSLVIAKAPTTTVVTLAAGPFTYTGSAITPATVRVTGAGGLDLTPAAAYADNVNAGTATASYSYAATDNYLASSDSKTFAIGKAATTTVVTLAAGPFTYTGSAITPATVRVTGAGGLDLTPAAAYADNVNAGTATASYSYAATDNYLASSDSKTFAIGKAATTTVVTLAAGPFTYTGSAITPATVRVTGAGGLDLTPAAAYADNVNAGTATASYSYAATDNYLASSDSKTFAIGKAATTTVVTLAAGPFTYTGSAITPATVRVTGAGGLDLTPAAAYADNVNAGTATASYSYAATDNYLASSDSKTFAIGKAATTTVVTLAAGPFTYTGSAITPATVRVTGAGGLDLTPAAAYADNVNAGTATASYSYAATDNYLASSDSKTFAIGKAATTTVVTLAAGPFTYTGSAITPATVRVTGAGGLDLTPAAAYADNVNAGTATASYSYAATDNYLASSDSKTFAIGKAATTTVVTLAAGPFTYTGSAITPATVRVTGAGGLDLTPAAAYADNVNAGTATASYSYAATDNYLASSDSKTFAIGKAATTTVVTLAAGPFTYTGSAITPATVRVTGAGGLDLTPAAAYADNVNAGTATASYSYAATDNYLASSDSKTFAIGKAATTTVVTLAAGPFTYTGSAITPATVRVTGAGGLDLTPAAAYADNVNAGTATASYSYAATDNYLASSDSKTFAIGKAATTTVVTLAAGPFTYTGSAITPATVRVTGAGGLDLTPAAAYADNVNAGTATASYSYAATDNYLASSDSKTFAIGKAATTTVVTLAAGPFTYTGSAITPATVRVTGAGGLDLTPAAAYADNVNAGTATASYSYAATDNYLASSDSKTFAIGKAATTTVVTLAAGPFTYTGSAITPATVRVTGAGGLDLTPAAAYADNVNAGTATASYSYAATDNYLASSDSKTFAIGKAATTTVVTLAAGPFTYTGSAITPATVRVTGAGGLDLTPAAAYADNVNAGTATASYSYAATDNYLASSDSKTFAIGKAATTTVVTLAAGPFTYTGSAITPATVRVTGAGGLDLTPAAAYADNVNAGTATASYSYAATDNYLASSDSKTFAIGKAATTTVVTLAAGPFTYTGSAITPATVRVTGAGGLDLTPAAAYADNVNAGTATASYSYAATDNYLASSDSKTFAIGKAATTTVVTLAAGPFTYTGSAITPATVRVTGAGGLDLTPAAAYADNVNAGTATASYSYAATDNYLASSDSKTFAIGKAATTTVVTLAAGPFTYTGSAITPATVRVTGAGGLDLTPAAAYADNVNAGTATASYSYAATDNYLASSDSKTFAIGKAATTTVVTLAAGPFTYTGSAITPATVRVTGAGGLDLTPAAAYADNVNAGTATASYSYAATDNYLASSDSKTFAIGKAATTTVVTLAAGPFTYTGSAITPATVRVTGAGGLDLTPAAAYADNVNAGTATASYSYAATDNYLASSDSKTFAIGKAATTTVVTLAAGPFTYTGSAITPATVRVTGAGGLDLTPAAAYADNVNAGTATASYSYAATDNYLASSDSKTFAIGKAATTTVVTLAAGPFTYTGSAITPATVKVTGAGGLNLTPAAVYANNTNAGTATASFDYAGGDNYLPSKGSETFTISKVVLTVTADNKSKYCGQTFTAFTSTITGFVNGETRNGVVTGTITYSGNASTADTYSATGYTITPIVTGLIASNYSFTPANGTLTVNSATLDESASSNPQQNDSPIILRARVTVPNLSPVVGVAGVTVNFNVFDKAGKSWISTSAVTDENGNATASTAIKLLVDVYRVEISSSCQSATVYLPVYDPTAGFVTGGGWITSPNLAHFSEETNTEIASTRGKKGHFAFVSRYEKGAKIPSGNTQFKIEVGSLEFTSTEYEWLVVSGSTAAKYKGKGNYNGKSGYGFLLYSTDGDQKPVKTGDTFRIKIWNLATGFEVYDNERGASEEFDATTAISSGSIVIHTPNVKATGGKASIAAETTAPVVLEKTELYNYPNTFSDRTTIAFKMHKSESYALEVYDLRGVLVKRVDVGVAKAGQLYEFELDGRNLSEGIYIARLLTPSGAQSVKMILRK